MAMYFTGGEDGQWLDDGAGGGSGWSSPTTTPFQQPAIPPLASLPAFQQQSATPYAGGANGMSPELFALLQSGKYQVSNDASWQKPWGGGPQQMGRNDDASGSGWISGMGDAYLDPVTNSYFVPHYQVNQTGGMDGTTERGPLLGYKNFDNTQATQNEGHVNRFYNTDGSRGEDFTSSAYRVDPGEKLTMGLIAMMAGGAAYGAMGGAGAAGGAGASGAGTGAATGGAGLGSSSGLYGLGSATGGASGGLGLSAGGSGLGMSAGLGSGLSLAAPAAGSLGGGLGLSAGAAAGAIGGGLGTSALLSGTGSLLGPSALGGATAGGAASGGLSSTLQNQIIKSGIGAALGGGGGSGGSGSGLGLGDLGSLIGGGVDYYNQNKASDGLLNWLKERTAITDNLYKPGSPEHTLMQQEMERKDAAAGRNSQYGTRAVDLAAKIAQIKAAENTRLTTGIGSLMKSGLDQKASSPAGLLAALGAQGGGGSLGSLANLFGGSNISGTNKTWTDSLFGIGNNGDNAPGGISFGDDLGADDWDTWAGLLD